MPKYPKPKILNEGNPLHLHVMKIGTDNNGKCECGREIVYDYGEYSEVNPTIISRIKTDILPYGYYDFSDYRG